MVLADKHGNQNHMVLAEKQIHNQWNRIESPRRIHTYMDNEFMTKEQRTYNGERILSSIYVGKIEQPRAKKRKRKETITSYHTQKSTQNRLNI